MYNSLSIFGMYYTLSSYYITLFTSVKLHLSKKKRNARSTVADPARSACDASVSSLTTFNLRRRFVPQHCCACGARCWGFPTSPSDSHCCTYGAACRLLWCTAIYARMPRGERRVSLQQRLANSAPSRFPYSVVSRYFRVISHRICVQEN